MTNDTTPKPEPISGAAVPQLARHLRFQHDDTRDVDVLLGPESVVTLNESSSAIVQLCDGKRDVEGILDVLEETYTDVDPEQVAHFLATMISRGHLELGGGA